MQRRDLRERREERARRSKEKKLAHWQKEFDAADTPLDLCAVALDLLRTRLFQWEAKAEGALRRARTDEEREAATARLEAARADVARVAGEAAEYLTNLSEQFDTTRV